MTPASAFSKGSIALSAPGITMARSIPIPSETLQRWQEIVDLLAEIMRVPSALVMTRAYRGRCSHARPATNGCQQFRPRLWNSTSGS